MSESAPRILIEAVDPQVAADAETVAQLLLISGRIAAINGATEDLRIAYGNAGFDASAAHDSRAFALLRAERARLRAAMVEIG